MLYIFVIIVLKLEDPWTAAVVVDAEKMVNSTLLMVRGTFEPVERLA